MATATAATTRTTTATTAFSIRASLAGPAGPKGSGDGFGGDARGGLVGGRALAQGVGVEAGVGEAVAGAPAPAVAGVVGQEPAHALLGQLVELATEGHVDR